MAQTDATSEKTGRKKKGTFREYVEALGTAIIIALIIRAFLFEAFKIPSGSMLPTLSIGDHIFVNKFVYGLRVPFTTYKFIKVRTPKRGEVIVFMFPSDHSKDFIKRVIGLPGDHVRVDGEDVWVNGEMLKKHELEVVQSEDDVRQLLVTNGTIRTLPSEPGWRDFDFYEEVAGEVDHLIQHERHLMRMPFEADVPPGQYFVMGDNRDNSADSREWGFVPEENIKGKAMFVWLPLDKDRGGIRWREFGRWIE